MLIWFDLQHMTKRSDRLKRRGRRQCSQIAESHPRPPRAVHGSRRENANPWLFGIHVRPKPSGDTCGVGWGGVARVKYPNELKSHHPNAASPGYVSPCGFGCTRKLPQKSPPGEFPRKGHVAKKIPSRSLGVDGKMRGKGRGTFTCKQ